LSLLNIFAIHTGDIELILLLVEKSNLNFSELDEDKNSIVHHAILKHDPTSVEKLLEVPVVKSLINGRNILGATPLAMAVTSGNMQNVQILLQHAADPQMRFLKQILTFFNEFLVQGIPSNSHYV